MSITETQARERAINWVNNHIDEVLLSNESEGADEVIESMADEEINFSIGIENLRPQEES